MLFRSLISHVMERKRKNTEAAAAAPDKTGKEGK